MSTFDEIADLVGCGEGNERWGVQPTRTNQGLIDAVRYVVEERERLPNANAWACWLVESIEGHRNYRWWIDIAAVKPPTVPK